MAGHSKWANIKRQKAKDDAIKGATFAKISRAIIVAARSGGSDPNGNFQLQTAIYKAKAAGIPSENINRAIAKGSGKLSNEASLESIRYEGYGAGGVAVILEVLTDNRNRTAADLRAAFSKHGGNLGELGCVSWMFDKKGVLTLKGQELPKNRGYQPLNEDALLEASLDAGAQSYELIEIEKNVVEAEVFVDASRLEFLSQIFKDKGYTISRVELRWVPRTTIEVTNPEQAKKLLRMLDTLEDLEDVQGVTSNFELAEDLLLTIIV